VRSKPTAGQLALLLCDLQAHYGNPTPPAGADAMARLLTRGVASGAS
jgi:hypothetical protein